jgi:hypothetical protein
MMAIAAGIVLALIGRGVAGYVALIRHVEEFF